MNSYEQTLARLQAYGLTEKRALALTAVLFDGHYKRTLATIAAIAERQLALAAESAELTRAREAYFEAKQKVIEAVFNTMKADKFYSITILDAMRESEWIDCASFIVSNYDVSDVRMLARAFDERCFRRAASVYNEKLSHVS